MIRVFERAHSIMFLIEKALISIPLHALACKQYHFFPSFLFSKHTFCAWICLKINLTFVHAFATVHFFFIFILLLASHTCSASFVWNVFCLCYGFSYSFNSPWPWTNFFVFISEKIIQTWHKFWFEFFVNFVGRICKSVSVMHYTKLYGNESSY